MHISYKMRLVILIGFILFIFNPRAGAQQFALYNTGTLFDSFENPSQKAFITDSSRHYAFNFFIPTAGFSYGTSGPGLPTIKKALYTGKYDARTLSEEETKLTRISAAENTYLLTFKLFQSVKYHRELGFSWQVKTENYGETTNQALIVFQDYQRIIDQQLNNQLFDNNMFNTNMYAQSYHQFGFTFRENYNKRLAYGIKLSYLSGIAYSKVKINSSGLNINMETLDYDVYVDGDLRTNFYYDDIDRKMILPGFKNPGLALSLSGNYRSKRGWYFLANLKDIGFIKWSKDSYMFRDKNYTIEAGMVKDSLWHEIKSKLQRKGYTSPINGKAEILLNKDLGNYQPNLLLSKNLFYKGGDIALVNTYRYKNLNLSLSTDYNLNNFFEVGAQVMIKSPNTEFFLGSDQLFKTMDTQKALMNSDETIGSGYSGASFYLGFSLKFGRIMSRPQNDNYIPGINLKPSGKPGFFQRIFGKRQE